MINHYGPPCRKIRRLKNAPFRQISTHRWFQSACRIPKNWNWWLKPRDFFLHTEWLQNTGNKEMGRTGRAGLYVQFSSLFHFLQLTFSSHSVQLWDIVKPLEYYCRLQNLMTSDVVSETCILFWPAWFITQFDKNCTFAVAFSLLVAKRHFKVDASLCE